MITPLHIAKNLIGVVEVPGEGSNPLIQWMLNLDADWPKDDSVPWCSAFMNSIAFLCGLPRSKSLAARSWLTVGEVISEHGLSPGYDIVIFARPPDPASGHVALFDGWADELRMGVWVVGGNQRDAISRQVYPRSRIIGCRRLGHG